MSTRAYLYRWVELSTSMWYIGSRTKAGCHPDDGYTCSSKVVKPKIVANPDDWVREVLCIGQPKYIRELEATLLLHTGAASDPGSYNQQNQDGKFCRSGLPSPTLGRVCSDELKQKISRAVKERYDSDPALRQRLSDAKKGKPGRVQTDEERLKRSATLAGRERSAEHSAAISAALTGRKGAPRSAEAKEKIGAARKGKPRSEETKQKMRDTIARKKLAG